MLALADPNFYIDDSLDPALDSTYVGYQVSSGSTSLRGVRLELSNFTGGVVDLAPGQSPVVVLPDIAAGTSAVGYLMVQASGVTTTPQTHTVTLYQGASALCERTFTFNRVHDTIKALANKVLDIQVEIPSDPVGIGAVVDVVVTGKTGTLGAGPSWDPGVLSYSPTSLSGFPAGSWRLERTEMTISPDGVAPATTYVDRLHLSGASGPDRPYTAVYRYRAIAPAAASSPIQPVQYIASGTQVKHTDPNGSSQATLPVISNEADLTLAKSADVATFPPVDGVVTGGRVTYTVSVVNAGSATGSVDSVVDTLPTGATFVTGSATVAGRVASPSLSGQTLTFYGPITVGAGGTTTITYQVDLPDVAGSYANSAVAYLATSTIDGSSDVTASDPASATVVVVPTGDPLLAADDAASTSASTEVVIPVLDNDTGTNLTITITRLPSNGTVVVDGSTVRYTPDVGFGGADTFEYSISDGISTDTATVTVSVPVARNDEYAVSAGSVLTVTAADGLLDNDFCSAAPCTVAVLTAPTAGTLTLATDGSFTYTAASTAQVVTFTYRLTDANGNTADATGTIYISDFGPDRAATPYETTVRIPVAANDTCTGTCRPTLVDLPVNGTATPVGDNFNVDYIPNPGFWGVDTFTYTKGGSGTALVTVLVGPPPATFTTPFGTPVAATPGSVGYVTGLETVSCTGCAYVIDGAPATGSVTMNPTTGAFTYTPGPASAGSVSFTYTVTEPGGLSVTGTVEIIVGPSAVDDNASVLASNSVTTEEVTFDVLANDSCPDTCTVEVVTPPSSGTLTQTGSTGSFTYSNDTDIGDITFTYRITSSTAPSVSAAATVTIRVEGAIDDADTTTPGTAVDVDVQSNDPCDGCTVSSVGTPTVGTASLSGGTVTYTSPADFAGVVRFPYSVTKNGGTTSAVITITVAPQAVDDAESVVLGAVYDLAVLGNDICAECVITAVTTPTGGSAVIDSSGLTVTYTAPSSGAGPFTFDYTITDSTGLTSTATVTLTPAVAPTAVDDSDTIPAGTTASVDVLTNDTCPTTCEIQVRTDPTNGSVSVSVTGVVFYTPRAGFTGRDTFTYALVGPNGLFTTAVVTIDVTPVAVDDALVMSIGDTLAIPVTENDLCEGCTVEIVSGPTGGSVDGVSGTDVTYTAPSTAGTYTFVYRVVEPDTDPASSAQATVTIVVSDAFPDAVATDHDTPIDIDVIANDPCAALTPACTIQSATTPSAGSVQALDATTFRYTPSTGFVGLATFTYTAGNGSMTADATVTVLVGPPPRTATTTQDTPVSGDLLAGATCPDCTVTLVDFAGSGEITLLPDGTWTYTPAEGYTGTDSPITYRITDPVTGLTRDGTLTVTVEAPVNGSVSIVKTAGATTDTDDPPNGAGDVGDTVTYTYLVTNTGDVTVTDVTVTDDKIADADISCTDGTGNVVASLDSAATTECTGLYVLTQADVDAGQVTNVAGVAATAGSGSVTGEDTATVTIARSASLSLVKTGTTAPEVVLPTDRVDAGDRVDFSIAVTNTGNVTLTDVTVLDASVSDLDCGDGTGVIASLAPDEQVTCTASVTLDQADIDAGIVSNSASVDGTAPDGATAPSTVTDDVTVDLTRSAALTVVKAAGPVTDTDDPLNGAGDPGDTIEYSYTITNTGNVTLTGVTLSDDKIPSEGLICSATEFAPGEDIICAGTYTITQADIDAGGVTNVASVDAVAPDGATAPSTVTDEVTVTITRAPGLTLVKSGSLDETVVAPTDRVDAGDRASYTYTVSNTGNVTLTGVTLSDDKIPSEGLICTGDATSDNVVDSLEPGASIICAGTYTITQADIDAGGVTNVASVDAVAPDGATAPSTVTDEVTVLLTRTPGIAVVKAAGPVTDTDDPLNGAGDPGDTIEYSYTITNTGNVTLTGVTLSDDKIPSEGLICTGGVTAGNVTGELAPGHSVECFGTYVLSEADVTAGAVTNVAAVTAYSQQDALTPVTDQTSVTVTIPTGGPLAADDVMSVPRGALANVLVLANDIGAGIAVTDVGSPSAGAVSHDGTLVTVVPPLNFVGTITVPYTITNGSGTSTALVTVHVTDGIASPTVVVYFDLNGNARQDLTEPGLPGVDVEFTLSSRVAADGSLMSAEPTGVSYRCKTGSDGGCQLTDIPVGWYVINPRYDRDLYGLVVTDDPDEHLDFETSVLVLPAVSAFISQRLDLASLAVDNSATSVFGVRGSASIAGTAFLEVGGGAGYQPSSDRVLPGQPMMVVWAGADGVVGTDDDVSFKIEADQFGYYQIDGLSAGNYTVRLDPATLPAGSTAPELFKVSAVVGGTARADVPRIDPTSTLPTSGADYKPALRTAMLCILLSAALLFISRRKKWHVWS